MNTAKRLLLALFLLSAAGCAPGPHDIDQARGYRMGLATHLGLSPEQIHVEAGRGVTSVTIFGVQSEADQRRIAADLATLNKNNPRMNPLKWNFQ